MISESKEILGLFSADHQKGRGWGVAGFNLSERVGRGEVFEVFNIQAQPSQLGIGTKLLTEIGRSIGPGEEVLLTPVTNIPTRQTLESEGVYQNMLTNRQDSLKITDDELVRRLVMGKLLIESGFDHVVCNVFLGGFKPRDLRELRENVFVGFSSQTTKAAHGLRDLDHVSGIARVRTYIRSSHNTGW